MTVCLCVNLPHYKFNYAYKKPIHGLHLHTFVDAQQMYVDVGQYLASWARY